MLQGMPRDLPAIRRKAQLLSPQPSEAEGEPTPTKAELRQKLRPIFDKLSADRSDAISAHELGVLLKRIKLERTPAQLKVLIAEAGLDESGKVGFTEFVRALHRQMSANNSELTAVVTQTSSFLDFLNPFSWLAKPPEAAHGRLRHGGGGQS